MELACWLCDNWAGIWGGGLVGYPVVVFLYISGDDSNAQFEDAD